MNSRKVLICTTIYPMTMTEFNSFLVDAFFNILRKLGSRDLKFYVNVYVPLRAGFDLMTADCEGLAELSGEVLDLVLKYRSSHDFALVHYGILTENTHS